MPDDVVRECVKDKERAFLFAFWLILGLIVYSSIITALYLNASVWLVATVEIVSSFVGIFLGAYIASYIYSSDELAEAECRALFETRKRDKVS